MKNNRDSRNCNQLQPTTSCFIHRFLHKTISLSCQEYVLFLNRLVCLGFRLLPFYERSFRFQFLSEFVFSFLLICHFHTKCMYSEREKTMLALNGKNWLRIHDFFQFSSTYVAKLSFLSFPFLNLKLIKWTVKLLFLESGGGDNIEIRKDTLNFFFYMIKVKHLFCLFLSS